MYVFFSKFIKVRATIVKVSSHINEKCMLKFKTLINELYNLDIKGY